MYSFIEEIKLAAKRAALFITGKGATMTAVSIAVPIVGISNVAFVGLAAGIPMTAAMSTMVHHHNETAILNNFRQELAANFHISPKEVTHDHLRSVAFSNPLMGIEAQPFFHQILAKNDKNRWIDIGANVLSALTTMAFLATQKAMITGAIANVVSAMGVATASVPIVSAIGLSLVIGGMMLATNNVLEMVGKELFSEKRRTGYDKWQGLARQKADGLEIKGEDILSVAASVNPEIKHDMQEKHGKNARFSLLSLDEKVALMKHYDPILQLNDTAAKINAGVMKVNEIAFIVAGEHSGVAETAPNIRSAQEGKHITFGDRVTKAKNWVKEVMHDRYAPTRMVRENTSDIREAASNSIVPISTVPMEQKTILDKITDTVVETKNPGATAVFKGDAPHQVSFAAQFADNDAERSATIRDNTRNNLTHVERLAMANETTAQRHSTLH